MAPARPSWPCRKGSKALQYPPLVARLVALRSWFSAPAVHFGNAAWATHPARITLPATTSGSSPRRAHRRNRARGSRHPVPGTQGRDRSRPAAPPPHPVLGKALASGKEYPPLRVVHAGIMGRSSNGELALSCCIFLCIAALALSITSRPCGPVGSATDGRSHTGTNMLETYFSASKMLGHLRSGPSGPYPDRFAAALEQQGTAPLRPCAICERPLTSAMSWSSKAQA